MTDIGPRPIAYPPETVLTVEQVAEWLQISKRTVMDLPLPRLSTGRLVRYSAGQVLAYLEGRTATEKSA